MQQVIMDGSSSSSSSAAPTWWSLNNTMPVPFPQPSSNPEMWHPDHGSQDLPESWCQLLLGGLVAEEEKHGFKRMGINDNCGVLDQLLREQQMVHPSPSEAQIAAGFHHQVSSSWNQNPIVSASSPRSCVTSSNMLDFSHKPRQQIDNNSSEGNSTETAPALKKAKVLGCSSPKSTLKVRKEKLGDRITTLHQLVSPFGKTDTASVLQEAIGYIRFLHSQIQALSSPYLEQPQAMRQQKQQKTVNDNGDGDEQSRKDLRSRGLCLVPVSFTMHVGSDNGADLWAAALGGGF
ncbi:transcription factor bHLH68-like isoform X1 [Zingiber officinale]|uniref:transcription factor bHLH68-like isoform X1 n=2 Tax=Zingiber officinale TaxID=94328 RepID=UPI001C4D77DA|nr:transcription factor bHLH68-like isoform X1 [Zingiber officinale]